MRRAVRPRPLVECVAAGGERPNFVCRDLPPETFRVGARPPWGGGERTGMNWLHFSTSEHSRREEPLVHGAQIVSGRGGTELRSDANLCPWGLP